MGDKNSHQSINSHFTLPIIFWKNDSVFRIYELDDPWSWSKHGVSQMNEYCKVKRILDASGKLFSIDRFEEVLPTNKISAFFRKWSWNTRIIPIIESEKQLDLEKFKREVRRAASARERYDLESGILEETMKKLPSATTYLEAIESLPKLI